MITQEVSSTQSARTSVASGGRLSILSEKLSRLSISSNQSGRPSVASDSVLLQKKGESGRLSHSYDDTDTQAITAHYSGRRSSKAPRLSTAAVEAQTIVQNSSPGGTITSKNIRFQLFPRTSDVVEQSISSVEPSSTASLVTSTGTGTTTTTLVTGILEEQTPSSTKKQLIKAESVQNNTTNVNRRQSLLRSPSSKYSIPKFPIVGKSTNIVTRPSVSPPEQGLLSPPISPQASSSLIKNKTLRGALGAIMPDLYFVSTTCTPNNTANSTTGNLATTFNDRSTEELPTVDENLHRLHVRIQYDDHRNDLIVNIIEGNRRDEVFCVLRLIVFRFSSMLTFRSRRFC